MENIWAPRILSRLFPTGLVESYFLKINDPAAQRAVWIKYTFLKPYPLEGSLGECWAILFDRSHDTPVVTGSKQSWELAACRVTADLTEIRIGENLLAPGMAVGAIQKGAISWRLSFSPNKDPALLLPESLYGDALPFARISTPFARSVVSGEIRFHDTVWPLDKCPMTVGHNWGRRHSDRYAWGQMRGESPFGEVFFEGFTRPKPIPGLKGITGATLLVGNRRLAFSNPKSWWSNRGSYEDGSWSFHAANDSHLLDGSIHWSPDSVATLRYVQPDGTVRWCRSSMVADGMFTLHPRFPGSSDLSIDFTTQGNAALEILDPALQPGFRILA